MKKLYLVAAVAALGLGACSSTVSGIKSDASRAGDKVENKLERVGDKVETQWERTKDGTQNRWNKTMDALKVD